MTYRTPEEAAQGFCPLARTFGVPDTSKGCRGPSCLVWRWEEITTAHPLWRDAVKAEAERIGDKVPYSKAAANVAADKAKFGMIPTRGYCGLGGKP